MSIEDVLIAHAHAMEKHTAALHEHADAVTALREALIRVFADMPEEQIAKVVPVEIPKPTASEQKPADPEPQPAAPKPIEPAAKPVEPKPEPKPVEKMPEPTPQPVEESKPVDPEEERKRNAKMLRTLFKENAAYGAQLLSKYGASRLSDVPADQLPCFMAEVTDFLSDQIPF